MTHFIQKLSAVGLGCCVVLGFGPNAAQAAEQVVLTYGDLSMDIPIQDLSDLAETGEPSTELGLLLALANQEPETLQEALTGSVPMNPWVLGLVLNSPPGDWMLEQVGETIQSSSGAGSDSALKAALEVAADDGQMSLIEVMQVYPSPEIVVQGDRLMETYSQVYDLFGPWWDLIMGTEP
ncbi:MAG: alpha/beta hydrolase [Cyanobacteria bacterium]|nr:alpha/beta hydrolase [Cyanobacteriota bacterium]